MINSLLFCVEGDLRAELVGEGGVELARRHEARVEALCVSDTRRFEAGINGYETAAYAVYEAERMVRVQELHQAAHRDFLRHCCGAGVVVDSTVVEGDPFALLTSRARLHDLVVCAWPIRSQSPRFAPDNGMSFRELVSVPVHESHPLLVLRQVGPLGPRVLVTYDGSRASAAALRAFTTQMPWSDVEFHLVSTGRNESESQEHLDALTARLPSGVRIRAADRLPGSFRRDLVDHIRTTRPDLVVFGVERPNVLLRRMRGTLLGDVLRRTSAAVYVVGQ